MKEINEVCFACVDAKESLVQLIASGATKVAPESTNVAPESIIRCDFRCDKVASESAHLMILGATCRT